MHRQMTACVVMVLTLPFAALAGPTTAELAARMAQRLEQAPVLRAEFIQEKRMAAFRKPLQTRGQLTVARDRGVIWQIDAPLKVAYVLADDRVVEIGEDEVAQVRTARDIPGLAQVGTLFRALLGARIDILADLFAVTPEGTLDAWRLTLTPRPGPIAQAIREIRMNGGRHVEHIRIEETNGDSATLVFRNFREDRELLPAERVRFGLH
ncbi:outer membrane lipoprotein carrier protein LolA [Accumulibacter sp.]|uniref:LolA family protein n=1 Tax=Accumulibacter sp. TaxID=2053492 RepID=UPI0025D0864A|nr:outer membrane lipoprotein carrier protein LolA [Accumulibacter sp.]MCM8614100.1 outer membrane lipoprotein carrier protein LolA [Accumulibacter sp.]MCM8637876.1 outer membrane lipoprotein carrier protein LolA [Accumulibacter sp.]MCM8641283.1 outer membrane lipoprotein carrier protein LolA [Accumulibacter sp.]